MENGSGEKNCLTCVEALLQQSRDEKGRDLEK